MATGGATVEPLLVEFHIYNQREVSRPDPLGPITWSSFAVVVHSKPKQRLVVADLPQTACYLAEAPKSPKKWVAGLACYSYAVGFYVTISRISSTQVQVRATEATEFDLRRKWSAGRLWLPKDHPIKVKLVQPYDE